MTKTLGYYSPAFFKMNVNVYGDIDLNSMSPRDFSVFFHEYIHFIQDFTTAACSRRIYVCGEYLRQSVTQTTNGANNTFRVPVTIHDYENNVLPNIKLMDNLEGDRNDLEIKSINDVMLFGESVDDKDGGKVDYEILTLDVNQGDYLTVGAYAIKESMAYLVEKLQDLNQWIEDVFSLGVCLRTHRPYFILEMARGKKDKDNKVLQFFAKNIGGPLMQNCQGQMYKLKMSGAEPPIEYLCILEQIYHLFKFGTKPCDLEKWCIKNPGTPEAKSDERCVFRRNVGQVVR